MSAPAFHWYHVEPGIWPVCTVHPDTPAIRKRVDTERGWYGSPEGAIRTGGVVASAFLTKRVELFDALAWLRDGSKVSTGFVRETLITAEPDNLRPYAKASRKVSRPCA